MNTRAQQAKLIKLKDSDLRLSSQAEDVRGRDVIDQRGKDIGKVNALFINEGEWKFYSPTGGASAQ
jgi:hypothetical protein